VIVVVQVISCSRGRGRQMNAGAQQASGDVLLFLHADSQLPDGYRQAMNDAWAASAAGGMKAPRCCIFCIALMLQLWKVFT